MSILLLHNIDLHSSFGCWYFFFLAMQLYATFISSILLLYISFCSGCMALYYPESNSMNTLVMLVLSSVADDVRSRRTKILPHTLIVRTKATCFFLSFIRLLFSIHSAGHKRPVAFVVCSFSTIFFFSPIFAIHEHTSSICRVQSHSHRYRYAFI